MSSEGYIPQQGAHRNFDRSCWRPSKRRQVTGILRPFHALYDHLERGLSTDDAIHALEGNWEIARSKFNKDEWQWKYEIDSESIEGDKIAIVIAVDSLHEEFTVVARWRD